MTARRRISDVHAFHLRAPLREPLGGSARRGALRFRESVIVRIRSDEGITGYGECAGPPEVLVAAARHLAPIVLGANPSDRNRLAAALISRARAEGSGGVLVAAMGAIDMALWDLNAKSLGISVAALLGGDIRGSIPVYAASVYFSAPDQAVAVAQSFIARGFSTIKVKVGLGLQDDLKRIAAIRDAIGAETRLLVDANGAYDATTAIIVARECAAYHVSWLEEPVPSDDLQGYQMVRRAVDMPIAGGESLHTRYGFAPWLSSRAIDIAMPDLGRCGGLTEATAIAAMASGFRIAVSPHCWGTSIALAASVQLAATLPNCDILEYDAHPDPLKDALLGEALRPQAGMMSVPDRPGLGVDVREEVIRDLAVRDSVDDLARA